MARSPLEKCLWWGLLLGDNQWSGARFRSRFSDETICAMWELLSRYWVQQPLYSSPPASSGRVKSRRGRLVISVLTKQSKPRSCSSCSRSWLSYHQKLRSTKPAHPQSWGNTEMFSIQTLLRLLHWPLTTDHALKRTNICLLESQHVELRLASQGEEEPRKPVLFSWFCSPLK